MKTYRPRRTGFTLVELLVVIGIIALLISILLPSLNRARQSALRVSCASNMRQLAMAWQNYSLDHKGQLALAEIRYWDASIANNYYWPSMLKPYAGDTESHLGNDPYTSWGLLNPRGIFDCPAFPDNYRDSGYLPSPYVSYGMVIYGVGGDPGYTAYPLFRKMSQITGSSERAVFVDSHYADLNGVPYTGDGSLRGWYQVAIGGPNAMYFVSFRHNKASNVAYADGHVETHSEQQMRAMTPTNWQDVGPWRLTNP